MPEGIRATVTHLQRGDTEMLIRPDLTLEIGDRVGLITERKSYLPLQKFFGNSIRGTTEFSYISLGIGMVMGVLLGIIPIPVPILGTMKLGIAGGSLIVALILGKLGRTGKLTWTMPLSANLTLRNFGLSIFLAQVGMSSGAPFVNVVSDSGLILLIAGACILFALALTPLLIGHYLMRIPFDDLLGITAGITGTPAILAYAYRSFPSERVDICYAMIYPAVTIMKIIIALLLIAISTGG
jgi:putative transport protein